MPGRPLRICSQIGCTTLTLNKTGRCDQHPSTWVRRKDIAKRITGTTLQNLRKQLFLRQPLCVLCLAKNPPEVALAIIRDHIQPLEEGGTDTENNTQGLCEECHDIKSEEEAKRGTRRYHQP